MARRVRSTETRIEVSSDRGVFMISVAAELAEMHPQTLRMYEARGLIEPKRSPKGTRLYSHRDVERLRRIQEMTAELGMNLAGVERVFQLEEQLESMARKVASLEKRAAQLGAEVARLEALRRELRAEIVPYARGGALVRRADLLAHRPAQGGGTGQGSRGVSGAPIDGGTGQGPLLGGRDPGRPAAAGS